MPPHHCVAKPVSHLPCPLPPNQSVICLAPATKRVSHLTCPLPPCHHITMSPCHSITASLCHCVSQSFALPPATKPVSHLTCPLPPWHHVTTSLHHCITMLVSHLPCPLPPNQSVIWLALYHCITASPCHRATVSLHQIFPTTWVWIWLVNAKQHSSDWLIVPTTANQITGIEKPN